MATAYSMKTFPAILVPGKIVQISILAPSK
jgi:hypothetical protein